MSENKSSYIKIKNDRFIVDMMYAKKINMVGRAVYREINWGNIAVVHVDLWERLEELTKVLEKEKLKLKICDAYRPKIAHEIMKNIIPIDGFFAKSPERSQHCLATAIDVCLCDDDGREFLFPTKVDAYKKKYCEQVLQGEVDEFLSYLKKARHDYFDEKIKVAISNRKMLKDIMESVGLESINHEWWHYNLPNGKIDRYPLVLLDAKDFC